MTKPEPELKLGWVYKNKIGNLYFIKMINNKDFPDYPVVGVCLNHAGCLSFAKEGKHCRYDEYDLILSTGKNLSEDDSRYMLISTGISATESIEKTKEEPIEFKVGWVYEDKYKDKHLIIKILEKPISFHGDDRDYLIRTYWLEKNTSTCFHLDGTSQINYLILSSGKKWEAEE